MANEKETEFDFWEQRLKLPCRCYNSVIDRHIYTVAKEIIDARKADAFMGNPEIAKELQLQPEYVELIQYCLADIHYPPKEGENYYHGNPFTYGTSPRGLFVNNEKNADLFLEEFRKYYFAQWKENINTEEI